jgi:hypothetical protein
LLLVFSIPALGQQVREPIVVSQLFTEAFDTPSHRAIPFAEPLSVNDALDNVLRSHDIEQDSPDQRQADHSKPRRRSGRSELAAAATPVGDEQLGHKPVRRNMFSAAGQALYRSIRSHVPIPQDVTLPGLRGLNRSLAQQLPNPRVPTRGHQLPNLSSFPALDGVAAERLLKRLQELNSGSNLEVAQAIESVMRRRSVPRGSQSMPASIELTDFSRMPGFEKLLDAIIDAADASGGQLLQAYKDPNRVQDWSWLGRTAKRVSGHLRRLNFQIGHSPTIASLRSAPASLPRIPRSSGGPEFAASLGMLLAVAMALAGVFWLLRRRSIPSTSAERDDDFHPIQISDISNGALLVQACHQMAREEFGPSVRFWHHLEIFGRLRQRFDDGRLSDLLAIYELARYASQHSLTVDQLERAKQILTALERDVANSELPVDFNADVSPIPQS